MNALELRRKRAGLIHDARALLDAAEAEKRELSAEENEHYDRIDGDIATLDTQIEREERQAKREGELDDPIVEHRAIRPDPKDGGHTEVRGVVDLSQYEKRDRFGFAKREHRFWLPGGQPENLGEIRAAWASYLRGAKSLSEGERRALQVDADTLGGYLVAPQDFVAQLIRKVDDLMAMRGLATIMPVMKAESLGVPTLEDNPADADWTAEIKTGSEDSSMDFGKRELRPHPMAKRIKVSNRLLRVSVLDVEGIVRDRLAYKFAVPMEKAYMTGSGSEVPLGIFTATADGISTARDVTIGTTTEVTADGLIDLKHTLKPQYWDRATWVMHRDVIRHLRKLKDGDGQYLWQMGLSDDVPDRILDRPYRLSEFAPNTFTTGQYLCCFGDYSFYWIADALDLNIQRLVELYAETNQTGFIGRYEGDGMPVLEEAFVRGVLA